MPTYDFECPEGHETEKFYRSIAGAPMELPCPVCGKMAVRQVSGGAGLVFKGSGFYITDYGKDGKKDQKPSRPSTAKPESSATDAAPAESKATDSKPASAPAPSVPAPSKATE